MQFSVIPRTPLFGEVGGSYICLRYSQRILSSAHRMVILNRKCQTFLQIKFIDITEIKYMSCVNVKDTGIGQYLITPRSLQHILSLTRRGHVHTKVYILPEYDTTE